MRILIPLILLPLIEIAVFVQVGDEVGALWTVLLTIATAVIGIALVQIQGIKTLNAAREQMAHGELPAQAMIEGVVLLLSGVCLLIPGFVTDFVGFLGLIPFIRRAIAGSISKTVLAPKVHVYQRQQGRVIEGDYERKE
ncbi:FxsA family protein [Bermanella sp. R86510]|uniref:FxsA family protein n=1 Tax=unclassified Bermanella TaxID=2627862 RepID=UPI0037C559AF